MCMCMWVHVLMSANTKRPEDAPGAGVTGNHEPPNVGAGNLTLVPYKSSIHS